MGFKPASVYMSVILCINNFKCEYLHRQWADHNKILAEESLESLGPSKATLCFGPDRTRTLISMATDSFHTVIMEKSCVHSSVYIFDWIFFILANNQDNHKISDGFEIRPDPTKDRGVSCPRTSRKIPIYMYKY